MANANTVDQRITSVLWNVEQNLALTEQNIARTNIGAQGTLTAGTNITIENNTISATDTTYSAGTGIDITNNTISADTTTLATKDYVDTELSGKQDTLYAGNNITITSANTIGTTSSPTFTSSCTIGNASNRLSIEPSAWEGIIDGSNTWLFVDATSDFMFIPNGSGTSYSIKDGKNALNQLSSKQDILTAGTNISIANNTIGTTADLTAETLNLTRPGGGELTLAHSINGPAATFNTQNLIFSYENWDYLTLNLGTGLTFQPSSSSKNKSIVGYHFIGIKDSTNTAIASMTPQDITLVKDGVTYSITDGKDSLKNVITDTTLTGYGTSSSPLSAVCYSKPFVIPFNYGSQSTFTFGGYQFRFKFNTSSFSEPTFDSALEIEINYQGDERIVSSNYQIWYPTLNDSSNYLMRTNEYTQTSSPTSTTENLLIGGMRGSTDEWQVCLRHQFFGSFDIKYGTEVIHGEISHKCAVPEISLLLTKNY